MSVIKRIYWRPDMSEAGATQQFANVHLLVGYTSKSIESFRKMADQLRETFPQATDDEITCEQVRESGYCKCFSLVTWNAKIPPGEYPGWTQSTVQDGKGGPDYWW
jgi:hypothetical protein